MRRTTGISTQPGVAITSAASNSAQPAAVDPRLQRLYQKYGRVQAGDVGRPNYQDQLSRIGQRITSLGGTIPTAATRFKDGGLVTKHQKQATGSKMKISKSPGRGYK